MSEEDVQVVRAVCEAWASGNFEAAYEALHPDAEWGTTHFEAWPEDEVYRGREEIWRFLQEWLTSWESYEADVEEIIDAGDTVVVFWRQRMTGRGSGVPVELDSAQVCTAQGGRVVRIDNYTDRGEALRDAGLRR